MEQRDYYKVLGVGEIAGADEIKKLIVTSPSVIILTEMPAARR